MARSWDCLQQHHTDCQLKESGCTCICHPTKTENWFDGVASTVDGEAGTRPSDRDSDGAASVVHVVRGAEADLRQPDSLQVRHVLGHYGARGRYGAARKPVISY